MLADQGRGSSRARTVAKYRHLMKVPPAEVAGGRLERRFVLFCFQTPSRLVSEAFFLLHGKVVLWVVLTPTPESQQ